MKVVAGANQKKKLPFTIVSAIAISIFVAVISV